MPDTAKRRHYPSQKKKIKKPEDIGETKYIDIYGRLGEPTGGFWSSENRAYMDILTIKTLFQSEDWVFLAVDAIADPISTLPLKVYKVSYNDEGERVLDADMSHKVNVRLRKPNKFSTQKDLLYGLAADYVLAGNSFAWLGDAGNLYHVPAEKVLYRWGTDNIPNGYYIVSDFDDAMPVPQFETDLDEMGHTKRPNPSSTIYGLSPFAPAKRSVLFNRYSQEYLNNFYLKGATPQMVLELQKEAQEKSLNRLQTTFEQSFVGRRNQRRTMILPKGVQSKVIENKIADQNLIELIEMNADRILSVLKVPKHVVGRQESGSLGSQEMKMAMKYFWQTTITDTANALSQTLSRLFYKQLGPEYTIEFDFDNVPELQEDVYQKAEMSNKMLGFMTVNEVRKMYWGLDPVAGGDVLASAQQTQPFFMPQTLSIPQSNGEKKNENKLDPEKIKQAIKQVDEEMRGIEKDKFDSRNEAALGVLIEQNLEAVDLLRKMGKKTLKARIKEFSIKKEEFEKRLFDSYEAMKEEYLDGHSEDLKDVTDLGFDQQLTLYTNPANADAIAASKERSQDGRYRTLADRGLFSFESVRDTSLDNVMKEITRGLEEGLSIDDVEKNIKKYFEVHSVNRANTVARTETLQALTVGQESVFDEAKEAGIEFNKVWITAQDERVRADHVGANGQEANDDGFFNVGGESLKYPRDPSGSASNTINCRCTVLMLPKDEDFDLGEIA